MPFPWSAGDTLNADELNKMLTLYTEMQPYSENNQLLAYSEDTGYFYKTNLVTTRLIYRFRRVGTNLVSYSTILGTTAWANLTATYDQQYQGVCLGGYIWQWYRKTSDSTFYLLRIAESDGSVTECTFSGTAPDDDGQMNIATDGTYIYIGDGYTTTLRKYSVSGSTLTYVSAITMPDKMDVNLTCDGTYFYFVTKTTSSPTNNRTFYKTDLTGSTQESFSIAELDETNAFIWNLMYYAGTVYANTRTVSSGGNFTTILSPIYQN